MVKKYLAIYILWETFTYDNNRKNMAMSVNIKSWVKSGNNQCLFYRMAGMLPVKLDMLNPVRTGSWMNLAFKSRYKPGSRENRDSYFETQMGSGSFWVSNEQQSNVRCDTIGKTQGYQTNLPLVTAAIIFWKKRLGTKPVAAARFPATGGDGRSTWAVDFCGGTEGEPCGPVFLPTTYLPLRYSFISSRPGV